MRWISFRVWFLVLGMVLGACRTSRAYPPPRKVAGVPTKKGVSHTVIRGQTLYRIAKTYGVSMDAIKKSNKIPDPEALVAGSKLWIPGAAKLLDVPLTALGNDAAKQAPAKPVTKPVAEAEKSTKPPPEKAKATETKPVAKAEAEPVKAGSSDETPRHAKPIQAKYVKEEPAKEQEEGDDETAPAEEKPAASKEKKPGNAEAKATRFIWPVKGHVQSQFGQRGSRPHDGIDIKADKGTPIIAADSGEVIYSGTQRGYGNIVLVKHDDELITIYAHNETNEVKQGERVKKGQTIATIGRTGRATNDHLHFEVRQNRLPKNPLLFLPEE